MNLSSEAYFLYCKKGPLNKKKGPVEEKNQVCVVVLIFVHQRQGQFRAEEATMVSAQQLKHDLGSALAENVMEWSLRA
jgi:hypothetical protein